MLFPIAAGHFASTARSPGDPSCCANACAIAARAADEARLFSASAPARPIVRDRALAAIDAHGPVLAPRSCGGQGTRSPGARMAIGSGKSGIERSVVSLAVLLIASAFLPDVAGAGCGCTKPPPAPAKLRPAAAWSGSEVTLFDDALVPGTSYQVRFESGTTHEKATASGVAVLRRDLADGVERPQIVVTLPALPLGPTAVKLLGPGTALLEEIGDEHFTVAPQPVGIPTGVGTYRYENYRAAVSRDGIVYLSLDFGDIQHARVFDARLVGLPLRYEAEDVAFWNIQGFLMQLLGAKMPGLFAIGASNGADSDVLHYSRHEFNTWFLQHGERASHSVDPSDANWHLDGTPHIDHDRQILAMTATWPDGSTPTPGATARATLEIEVETLFAHGVVGRDSVLVDQAVVRSDDGGLLPLFSNDGDVLSNGPVQLKNQALVTGDATGSPIEIELGSTVLGALHPVEEPVSFLPVDVPPGLVDLGDFVVSTSTSLGVGSYFATKLEVVAGATLRIENADGPVTVYVDGDVTIQNAGQVVTDDSDPEKFAIYLAGESTARFTNASGFHGVVYGPDALVEVDNDGVFAGAFVGGTTVIKGGAEVIYTEALHANVCPADPLPLEVPGDLRLLPGRVLELPIDLGGLLDGHELRIGRREASLLPIVGDLTPVAAGVLVPADLEAGVDVELALVDANGCRSWRTLIVPVPEPSAALAALVACAALASLQRTRSA